VNTRDVFGREAVPVVTAAEATEHDRVAQDDFDIPERALMENAGRALALITNSLYPTGVIAGVAGSGHNGGDTMIALQALRAWGRDVELISAADPDDDLQLTLASASVILDGLLGTGATGAPRERTALLIRAINAADKPVIAVDLPSGTNPDTGAVYDDVVTAAVTVCFGFPKIGLLLQPARAQCGRLVAVEIGFPPLLHPRAQLITSEWAARHFPTRPPNANKGTSGRLLLVAGSAGMAGAAVIAGNAAVRSGAGLVRIVSARDNREIVQKGVPEATFFERESAVDAPGTTAIVAGPGMGATDDTRSLLLRLFEQLPGVPALLDADALNVFAGDVDALERIARERPLLVTPHPKEMSRLSGDNVERITADPMMSAHALAGRTGAQVLLKGQPSLVASKDAPLLINTVGSSDTGVAGMGDQLAGVIGAFMAAGLAVRTAAALGLYYGGRAADLAALGRALTPTDVTAHLARAFADPGPRSSALGYPFITFDQPARW
jgi:ADP-dependent NAD(P)H-hydrate dehydratase / NAD(P)H-hydrate epimerase